MRVSPQHAQAFQTPAWADATPQPTIAVASARFSLQTMHVTVFTAERRLAPAASSETASSSRRIPVSCIIVKESRTERPRGSQRGYPCRKTAILIVTIRRLLFPRSFTRPPVGIPCGLLSAISGEGWAYHVPYQLQNRLGLASTPVAIVSTMQDRQACIPATYHFGHSVTASYAALSITARERRFRYLDHTILSLLPTALRLAVAVSSSRLDCHQE